MIFVISSKGFFEKCEYNPQKKKMELYYTKSIQNAKIFQSLTKANKFIKNKNLFAFAWNPKIEEPIRNKYKVVYGKNKYDFSYNILPDIWVVERVVMESKTDLKFLNNSSPNESEYYDFETANKICNEKNLKLIEQIKELTKNNIIL